MAVITVSRQFGAGGRTIGERLAKKLGYRYVHEDMIKEVAIRAKVSDQQILEFEKRGSSKLTKFLEKVVNTSYVERLTAERYGYVDESVYVDTVKSVILDLYSKGNVVIIGRGSQYILKNAENTWHIFLVGDMSVRIRFLMEHYYLNEAQAEKAIRRADHIRRRFLSFYATEDFHNNPLSYDLTLNMNRISMEKAESLVLALLPDKK